MIISQSCTTELSKPSIPGLDNALVNATVYLWPQTPAVNFNSTFISLRQRNVAGMRMSPSPSLFAMKRHLTEPNLRCSRMLPVHQTNRAFAQKHNPITNCSLEPRHDCGTKERRKEGKEEGGTLVTWWENEHLADILAAAAVLVARKRE